MDALLDPACGLLAVSADSATAQACRRDMALIRATCSAAPRLLATPSASSAPPPFTGHWRGNNGVVTCGTLRIFSESFDTNPADDIKAGIVRWVCETLNAAQRADAPKPLPSGGRDAMYSPPLHLVNQVAALIAADLLGQATDDDRLLVSIRLVELLVRANIHPRCPPPADEVEAAEREHLGCAYCGTGIYHEAERPRAAS
ncbi:hypothetical protein [Cupriavidus pampae]|nr:hypothetical protein [Cupriavidus pampae]